jgi:hypothetical protein
MALDHENRQAIGEFVFDHSFSQARRSGMRQAQLEDEAEGRGKGTEREA